MSSAAVPEWLAAGAFGLVTVFTLLLRNVPSLQENLVYVIFFASLFLLSLFACITQQEDQSYFFFLLNQVKLYYCNIFSI